MEQIADAYAWIPRRYYLLNIKSKAITQPFLIKMIFADSKILKALNETRKLCRGEGQTVSELFGRLEGFLKAGNHPPTGLDHLHLPNSG